MGKVDLCCLRLKVIFRTVALTSWEQVIIDSDKCTSQCPWKMQNRIDDIELKLINLWHSYTSKKPANIIKYKT